MLTANCDITMLKFILPKLNSETTVQVCDATKMSIDYKPGT
jgi:hypothetical protein